MLVADVRAKFPREKDPAKLRHWISLLLARLDLQETELARYRAMRPEVSTGIVNSQTGRE
jgi:hypothetical protein